MFRNLALEGFLILLIFLVVLSMIPLIELKYHSDLYETIENFNKYCLNNDIDLINDLDVKDTYMWNMANYLYNFENIDEFFLNKFNNSPRALDESNNDSKDADTAVWKGYDYVKLADGVIIGEQSDKSILYLYRYYQDMSSGFFILLIVLIAHSFYIYIYKGDDLKICASGDDENINDFLRYSIYALIVYILLFVTVFSIISKKITEIYKDDTETYEYIMLMKELDILLKENKITDHDNKVIIEILKKHSKNKIIGVEHVAINKKDAMYELSIAQRDKAKKKKNSTEDKDRANKDFVYVTNNNRLIRLHNINRLAYYNSDDAKNKVKNKVTDIFRFIYAYVFFLIVPIYILSISLKGNYVYLLGTIIAIIIFSVAVYNMYNTLR